MDNKIIPFSDPKYSKLLTRAFAHKKKRVRKKNLKRVGKDLLGEYDYDDTMREIVYSDYSNCPDRPYTKEIIKSERCRTFYGRMMATQEISKFYSVQSLYGEIIANFSSLYKSLYWINRYWAIDCSKYSPYEYPDVEKIVRRYDGMLLTQRLMDSIRLDLYDYKRLLKHKYGMDGEILDAIIERCYRDAVQKLEEENSKYDEDFENSFVCQSIKEII